MSDSEKSNDDDNERDERELINAMEARRIIAQLNNQVRRAEGGCIVQILKENLLEHESCTRMRSDWIYGIISNEVDVCPITCSVAYQVNWAYAHLPYGNSCLAFVAPVWEHDLDVLKFPEDDNDEDDYELRRQFIKVNGEWSIVDYGGYSCEFCEAHCCDRAQYREELDGMLEYVRQLDLKPNQKRYQMYRRFISEKHGFCGTNMRHMVDDCVQELIVATFPVETGKRKRGYRSAGNDE